MPTTAGRPSTSATGAGCPPTLAGQLRNTEGATQILTVVADAGATTAVVTAWQRSASCWRRALGPYPARIGVSGVRADRREGDGSTPIGIFPIGTTMYGNAADPGVRYPYHRLVCGDYWDEDPSSAQYNSFVHVACGATPSWARTSEGLWRVPVEYASFAVIGFNIAPVVPGRGSGIFLAVAAGHPTVGCVSLDPAAHDAVLRWLDPSAHPAVAIGTPSGIPSL